MTCYLITTEIQHLVILLNNGLYRCSCFSLVNYGTVCWHYFSVMLCTSQAVFHVGYINPRWYVTNHPDLKKQSFCCSNKFKNDVTLLSLDINNIIFLNTAVECSDTNTGGNQYVSINKQKMYYANGVWFISSTITSSTVHFVNNHFVDSSFRRQFISSTITSSTVHFVDSSFRRQFIFTKFMLICMYHFELHNTQQQ